MNTITDIELAQARRSIAIADERKHDGEYGPWEAIGVLKSALESLIAFVEKY
jgi:hypothetical protein